MIPGLNAAVLYGHRLAAGGDPQAWSDAALLDRFARCQDQGAFAALVARHGGMVLNVCRRVLGDAHAAEDALQNTFLLLARKAGSLRRPEGLAAWLHGVAYRVARKARGGLARRAARELLGGEDALAARAPDPLAQVSGREVLLALEEEVQRLPEGQRLAVVLVCLEGLSREEAAARLGATAGQVKGWLERGRKRLHDRLVKRGLTLPAALAALAAVTRPASAAVRATTARLAVRIAGGPGASPETTPARAVALGRGALRSSALARLLVALGAAGVLMVAAALAAWPSAVPPESAAPPAPPHASGQPPAAWDRVSPAALADRFDDALPTGALARLGTVRLRHAGYVYGVAFAPDGRTAVSAGQDGRACLWDVATGRKVRAYGSPRRPLAPHAGALALALTRDGRTLAIGYDSFQVPLRLFDVRSGQELPRREGHTASVRGVSFLPDGRLVSAAEDDTIRVWESATGKELLRVRVGHCRLRRLAVSADGKTMASGGDDRTVRLWDVATGRRLQELEGHTDTITGLAFSPDGRTLVSGAFDGPKLLVWEPASGRVARKIEGKGPLAFSPDGGTLATAGAFETIVLWQADTGKERRRLVGHKHFVEAIAFSPDGRLLASAGRDGTVRFWAVDTGRERSAARGHESDIATVAFAPDGKAVVTGGWDSTLRTWDPVTGAPLRVQDLADYGAVLPSGQRLAQAYLARSITGLGFSPDGRRLAVGGSLVGRLIEPATGRMLGTLATGRREGMLSHLVCAPDGKALASAAGNRLCLWDASTGKLLRRLPDQKRRVRALAFSPDGRLLATACAGRTGLVRLWAVPGGKLAGQIKARREELWALAFAPDGQTLAVGTCSRGNEEPENAIELWDPAGHPRGTLTGRFPTVRSLAFSPDGKTLAAGASTELYLWETATGRERGRFIGHAGNVNALAFAPDGRAVVTASADTTALVWDLTGGHRAACSLKAEQWRSAWAALGDGDTRKAYRAMWALACSPQTVAELRKRLRPVAAREVTRIERWIGALDDERFAVRQQAQAVLEKRGHLAELALRRALERRPSVEVRRRLERLLEGLANPSADRLRELRALEALGHIGGPTARALLEELAAGAPAAPLTRDARAVLRQGRKFASRTR